MKKLSRFWRICNPPASNISICNANLLRQTAVAVAVYLCLEIKVSFILGNFVFFIIIVLVLFLNKNIQIFKKCCIFAVKI